MTPPSAPEVDVVLSASQDAYLQWLCDPLRKGGKQDQADALGVNRSTITRWENNGAFRKAWTERVQELGGSPDRLATAYDALYEQGLAGNTNAMKLWLQATGNLRTETEAPRVKSVRDLSDEELDALLAERARAEATRRVLRVVGADA
jgi:transcriptional regulator with XRE-family HTH domain